jgi:transcriptional regulator with XRE-family HTH domain
MEDICARVGFSIREIREDKNLSQEQLANRADLHRAYGGKFKEDKKIST